MENFKEQFNAIIIENLAVDEKDIKPESLFGEDLGADSLDVVEFIMEFEKKFDVKIPDDAAEKIKTIGDAEQ